MLCFGGREMGDGNCCILGGQPRNDAIPYIYMDANLKGASI